jgi:nitrite reductase/ring-hydroxylating ferredoxin subunit
VAVADLDASQVTVVEDTSHGAMAVGMSAGKPFAVSNRCRHLFASLGEGEVTPEGCLQCPWHGARYDVRTGKMVRGPQGAFKPVAGVIKATTGAIALKTFPVELREGAIWLVG